MLRNPAVWLLAVLALGSALADGAGTRVVLYRGFAEVVRPVAVKDGVWVWNPGEAAPVPGTLRLFGLVERKRVWQGDAVVFFTEGSGPARLGYLTRALSGRLDYALDLDAGTLTAWVTVENRGPTLRADELWYVAGAVPLVGEGGGGPKLATKRLALAAAPAEAAYQGAAGGVFRYRFAGGAELVRGRTELPFQRGAVRPLFLWRYRGGFVKGDRLVFQRGYRFDAPWPLAAGRVSLWKAGAFLGQATLPDRPQGEPVEFWLGPDPLGRAERKVEVLEETRERARYRVTTRLENRHAEPVRVEIEERFPTRGYQLKIAGAERVPGGYRLGLDLAPGGRWTYVYEVTLLYR